MRGPFCWVLVSDEVLQCARLGDPGCEHLSDGTRRTSGTLRIGLGPSVSPRCAGLGARKGPAKRPLLPRADPSIRCRRCGCAYTGCGRAYLSNCVVLRPVSRASVSRLSGCGGALGSGDARASRLHARAPTIPPCGHALDIFANHCYSPPSLPCAGGQHTFRGLQCRERTAHGDPLGRAIPSSLLREEMHVSRSSVCRCMLVVLAALLARPARRAGCRPSRRHVRDARRDLLRLHGPSQVNATQQYWQLFQVTQDGLTAFRKSSGPRRPLAWSRISP